MKLNKLIYLLLVIIIVLSINVAFRPFHSSLQWAQKPFHSSLEATGALCAFVLSIVLFMLRKYSAHKPYHLWIICGLLSMGLLDFFHAFGEPGESFVWLHSSATLMGGFLFAMVWLPDRMLSPRIEYYLPVAIMILSFLLGLSLMFMPEVFPKMLKQGEFTLTAKSINLVGGLFFISASIWFTKLYLLKKDPEGILFANHCLLFGFAGIIFDFSQLWDTQWWLWHFIRLTAYAIALYYVFNGYKQTANALQESEAQLRVTFNQAAVGMAHAGINGEWLRVNQKLCDIVKYRHDEMIRLTLQDVTHPADREADLEKVRQLLDNKIQTYTVEKRYVKKDGSQVWINLTASVVRDASGNPKYFIYIIEDISGRKQAEEKMGIYLSQLEKANKELSDFAYIVSHDLKEPLRAVHSLANWIITDYADKFDDEGKEKVNLLKGRIRRMNDLVEGILQYSRAGRLIGEKTDADLNNVASEVISILNPPEHINVAIEGTLPIVHCERTSIAQVFQNLIGNAVRYMDKPEGNIKISAGEERDFWKISVSDNGPGIDEKDHEKIFQMFRILHPRDKVEASGVGLAVVKKIVEMYGGRVWVESNGGQGSRFCFTIPK